MIAALDRFGLWLLELTIMTGAWLSLVMIAMMACRQPVRRRALARAGIIGSLILGPLHLLPLERVELIIPYPRLPGLTTPGRSWDVMNLDDVGRFLTTGYLLGVGVGIAWFLLGTWASRRLINQAGQASPWAIERYHQLITEEAGKMHPAPRLRVSSKLGRPALVGGFQPAIVIPSGWDQPGPGSDRRLEVALLHELAHTRRHDPCYLWLATLMQAIWFLIPPAWWIRRQLLIDQEFLADDHATRQLGASRPTYAATLVELASEATESLVARTRSSHRPESGNSSDRSPLLIRVAMLLQAPFPIHQTIPAWWRTGIATLMGLLLLMVPRISIQRQLSERLPIASPAASTPFHLIELELHSEADPDSLRLPAQLPDAFELSALLFADPEDFGQITIAGYRLGAPTDFSTANARTESGGWHQLRMKVEGSSVRLWIDDHPVVVAPAPASTPAPEDSGRWLTIGPPPGGSLLLRDLILTPSKPTRPTDATV